MIRQARIDRLLVGRKARQIARAARAAADGSSSEPAPANDGEPESRVEETPPARTRARRQPVNSLNDLTAKEWIPETVSVWLQRGLGKSHADTEIERQHPAPFSYQDVARLVRFFTKAGDLVLDPFAGVGSTLKAAALEGRRGIGIELNPKYADLAKKRLQVEVPAEALRLAPQQVICGDSAMALKEIEAGSVRLVVTSPPYWNILHKKDHKANQERVSNGLDTQYSNSDRDLGNISDYNNFIVALTDTLAPCHGLLTPGGHMCVVVGDFRHKSDYYMFHADIASSLAKRGFKLKGLKILYQRHKRVFPYGYPYSYVPNLHHQYIVILERV